jgi:hypothetical protein
MMIGWSVLILGLLLVFIVGFSLMEGYALKQNDPDAGITLSQFVVNIFHGWPPSILLLGLVVGITIGILTSHFLWVWVPAQRRATCGQCGKTILLSLLLVAVLIGPALALDLTLPDPKLTPGAATDVTAAELCAKEYHTRDVRSVTAAMKREVFARYGLTDNKDKACKPDKHGRRCEVDHLVSLELGGANAIENLWPQPFGTKPWNAQLKDKVENRLHKEVCAGAIALEQAQQEISSDYRIPYVRYFGAPK